MWQEHRRINMHVSSGNGTVRFSQPGALQSVCLARGNINHHIVPVSKSGSSFILIPCGSSKAEAAAGSGRKLKKTDILLDDYTENLNEWRDSGGTALKLLNGINDTKGCWDGSRVRNSFCYEDIRKHISA